MGRGVLAPALCLVLRLVLALPVPGLVHASPCRKARRPAPLRPCCPAHLSPRPHHSHPPAGRELTLQAEKCGCESLVMGSRGLGISKRALLATLGVGSGTWWGLLVCCAGYRLHNRLGEWGMLRGSRGRVDG